MRKLGTYLVLALFCSVGVAGGAGEVLADGVGSAPAAIVPISVTSTNPHGIRVFYLENPASFGYVRYWVNSTGSPDFRPWHMQLIHPNGTISMISEAPSFTQDGDSAHLGLGDGVAYAGVSSVLAQTPDALGTRYTSRNALAQSVPGTEGWLVLAWGRQDDSISFTLHFPPGTRVTPVAEGSLAAYEMKDFQGGARAGVPAVVVANLNDSLTFDPEGGQLWGYVFYIKSSVFGRGNITVHRTGDGWHRVQSMDATLDRVDEDRICICWDSWRRWVFTSESPMDMTFNFLAEGGRTQVFVVVATLPPGTLPSNLWQEFDQTPPEARPRT